MNFKRILSLFSAAVMLFTTNVFAQYNSENNIVAKKSVHTISPGLEYTSTVEICDGLRQEIYSFKYTPGSGTSIVPAYGEYIYGFNSVGQLISSYDGEGRVVGGINTDFFITSTGIPLSCLISDGEIISSCDNRPALGFDEKGNAVIGYPKISANFISEDRELTVAHINKTPAVWGMYLVTDKFSATTRSSLESIEIVFRPFIKSSFEEDNLEIEALNDTENDIEPTADSDDIINEEITDMDSTDTQESIEENTLTEEVLFSFESYIFTDENIEAGRDIDVVVTEIRDNTMNSEIPKDSFVLCIPKEQFGYLADGIKVGDEFVLTTQIDEKFSECTNIFGVGSIILENGEFVEQPSDRIYKYRNPRTAAGVLTDGSVVFVAVDGRSSGKSEGFTINELADYLKNMGCVSAVNFDGGGSTTFYAADIGEIYTELKNTPSEGSERRVADGLIFVNTTEPTQIIEYGAIYPSEYFVYSGGSAVDFSGNIYFADSNLHPYIENNAEIYFSVDSIYGDIDNTTFVPNGTPGRAAITATVVTPYETKLFNIGYVNITDIVNKIDLSASNIFLTPFDESAQIDVKAYLNTIPVEISPQSIEWDVHIKKELENGDTEFFEADSEYAEIFNDTMEFVPFVKGEIYVVSANIGDFSQKIEIHVDEIPYSDMNDHWATKTAYNMYKSGFMKGEISSDGSNVFAPDRNMTRAEFYVVLARILGIEPYIFEDAAENSDALMSDSEADEMLDSNMNNILEKDTDFPEVSYDNQNFEEEHANEVHEKEHTYSFEDFPEWARGYIKALFDKGYISELISENEYGDLTISADEFITRGDVIKFLGSILKPEEIGNTYIEEISNKYPDYVSENEKDLKYFAAMIKNGIITGFDDGTIRQNSNLTRAEAATVFSRFYDIFKE